MGEDGRVCEKSDSDWKGKRAVGEEPIADRLREIESSGVAFYGVWEIVTLGSRPMIELGDDQFVASLGVREGWRTAREDDPLVSFRAGLAAVLPGRMIPG